VNAGPDDATLCSGTRPRSLADSSRCEVLPVHAREDGAPAKGSALPRAAAAARPRARARAANAAGLQSRLHRPTAAAARLPSSDSLLHGRSLRLRTVATRRAAKLEPRPCETRPCALTAAGMKHSIPWNVWLDHCRALGLRPPGLDRSLAGTRQQRFASPRTSFAAHRAKQPRRLAD